MSKECLSNVERKSKQIANPHILPPMNDKDAATYLGVGIQTLRNWRCQGKGPAYHKLSPGPRGRVTYEVSDLDEYKALCRIDPASR